MRVAADLRVLSTGAADRGMGRYTREVIRAFLAVPEIDVFGITFEDPNEELVAELESQGMKVLAAVEYGNLDSRWQLSQHFTTELETILREHDIDVFLDCSPYVVPGRLDLGAVATVPIFYDLIPFFHQHEYLEDYDFDSLSSYVLASRVIARADHVIAISGAVGQDAHNVLGLSEDKVTVHYPALDADYLSRTKRIDSSLVPQGDFTVAVTGVHKSKGLKSLLTAYQQVRANGSDLQLVVVLPEDWTLAKAMKLGPALTDGVDFRIAISETEKVSLQTFAKFVIHPSIEEGYGIPMSEAIAVGTPVIAAENPLNREIGNKGVEFYESGNPNSLAQAIARLCADDAALATLRSGIAEDWAELKPKLSGNIDVMHVLNSAKTNAERRAAQAKFALSGPLPPIVCGIADYTGELAVAMSQQATVDVFVDTDTPPALLDRKDIGIRPLASLPTVQDEYERVFVQVGGEPWFTGQLETLASGKLKQPWVTIHDYGMALGLWRTWKLTMPERSFLIDVVAKEPDSDKAQRVVDAVTGPTDMPTLGPKLNDVSLNAWLMQSAAGVISHLPPPEGAVPPGTEAKVTVFPLGAPDPYAQRPVHRTAGRNSQLVVGTFGTVVPTKLVHEIIEATARLRFLGTNVKLRVVGPTPDLEYLGQLHELIKELDVEDLVEFIDRVNYEHLADELASWDIGIALRDPIRGGMSAALVRMLSIGMPLIMTDTVDWSTVPIGAVLRVSSPNSKIPLGDELAATLSRLCADEALRHDMAAKSRAAYRQYFTAESMATNYVNVGLSNA